MLKVESNRSLEREPSTRRCFYQERASEARKKSALASASREERFSYRPILEAFRKPSSPIPIKGKLGAVELARREKTLNGGHSTNGSKSRMLTPNQIAFNNRRLSKPMIAASQDFLSAHFSLDELSFSDTAIRLGLDNKPPPEAIEALRALTINVLEPVRLALGAIKVNSGFRCERLNKLVGGSPTSQHMLGEAADIRPFSPIVSMAHLYSWLAKWVDYSQLIWEYGGAWVHVAYRRVGVNQKDRLVSYIKDGRVHYRPVVYSDNLS